MTHVAATKLVLLPYSLGFGGRSIEQKEGSGSDQDLFLSPFSDVGMGLARPAGDVPLVVPSCQQSQHFKFNQNGRKFYRE
jgi:hypothetical protein